MIPKLFKIILNLVTSLGYSINTVKKYLGLLRELNPGPPVPETGIMPLDQVAMVKGIPNFLSKYTS